jgi:Rod binding domain-containing protein
VTPLGLAPVPASEVASHAERARSDERLAKAAEQFEAIMLRAMLKPLERMAAMGESAAGQSLHGSMAVEALADAIAKAGGLGLAQVIAGHLGSVSGVKPIDNTEVSSIPGNPDHTVAQAIAAPAVQLGVHSLSDQSSPATLPWRHR